MTAVAKTVAQASVQKGQGVVVTWNFLGTNNDSGNSVSDEIMTYMDRSVQVSGTYGGATVVIEGSNDGAAWFTLTDPFEDALSFATSDNLMAIVEPVKYIRPTISSSSGTTDLDVTLLAVGGRRGNL
jgi:hypothetical protein